MMTEVAALLTCLLMCLALYQPALKSIRIALVFTLFALGAAGAFAALMGAL